MHSLWTNISEKRTWGGVRSGVERVKGEKGGNIYNTVNHKIKKKKVLIG